MNIISPIVIEVTTLNLHLALNNRQCRPRDKDIKAFTNDDKSRFSLNNILLKR